MIFGPLGIELYVNPLLEVPPGYYDDGPPWPRWRRLCQIQHRVFIAPSLFAEIEAAIPKALPRG